MLRASLSISAVCIKEFRYISFVSIILIRKMTEINTDTFYEAILKLTKEAGKLITDNINNRNKLTEVKASDIDLVTETDKAVEKLLMDGLSKQFKDHKFIGEETVSAGGNLHLTDAPTWIIDPIDGTLNFIHSFPHSCVSVALFIEKKPEIGIIYNPMMNQLFTARRGKGAFLNGNQIHVSNKKALNEALIMLEGGTSRDTEKMKTVYQNQQKLMPKVQGSEEPKQLYLKTAGGFIDLYPKPTPELISRHATGRGFLYNRLRALGSAALNMAMVALGAADAYFEFGIHIWDIAAGELIIKEAGGVVIDPSGDDLKRFSRRVLAASSPELAEKLSKELVQFYPTPDDS